MELNFENKGPSILNFGENKEKEKVIVFRALLPLEYSEYKRLIVKCDKRFLANLPEHELKTVRVVFLDSAGKRVKSFYGASLPLGSSIEGYTLSAELKSLQGSPLALEAEVSDPNGVGVAPIASLITNIQLFLEKK